ncbi:PEPxxWA-CTERM sorting domain-containing protein [Glacieibacterium frigidum]|uniref:PEP-CTERM sorting domain-containing protein n=1 Tax=Glacieibacterium frigidum TaxID=2593303 RepID=A0A552UJA1_9SPHN|nr:PEPxxWA-CTERM sorting domain-containing protein [Glacieibacterium frigidum]TRW18264.1 PEP-CTERM sorting domain-containing protein [Glacieibacterium frigidum]
MKLLSTLALAAGFAVAAPAAAVTTFATFTATSLFPSVEFTGAANGAGTLSSTAQPVTFRFLDAVGGTPTDFDAIFNLLATTAGGSVTSGIGFAPVIGGSFSFTSASAVTFGGATGTNFLTGTFSGSAVTAQIDGTTANYGVAQPPAFVTFTSDFLDFSQSTARDLAFAITGINPTVSAGSFDGGVGSFAGTITGSFSADQFAGGGLPVVPEPATWALMIGGFGMVGTAMRRRKSLPTVTA